MSNSVKLPRLAKGKRPKFFRDPGVDQLYSITLELAAELSVALERIDTLERLLDQKSMLSRAEVEGYRPDDAVEVERAARRDAYLQRILRVLAYDATDGEDDAAAPGGSG